MGEQRFWAVPEPVVKTAIIPEPVVVAPVPVVLPEPVLAIPEPVEEVEVKPVEEAEVKPIEEAESVVEALELKKEASPKNPPQNPKKKGKK